MHASVPAMFINACETFDKPNAAMVKRDGAYVDVSHQEFRRDVESFAKGLIVMGLRPKEHIAILGETRYEWAVADLGTLAAGAVNVPIYPTLSPEQIAWILNDSDSAAVIVSSREMAEKVLAVRKMIPMVRFMVVMDPVEIGGFATMKSVITQGSSDAHDADLATRIAEIDRHQLMTIIYTSGTTGNPKGVMLTHVNLLSNVEACMTFAPLSAEDIHLSHLPLSHVLERMAGFYISLNCGVTIAYAESIDTVRDNLLEVRPTVLFSVPRLFEKIYSGIQTKASEGNIAQRVVFRWAMGVGKKAAGSFAQEEKPKGYLGKTWDIADKLVYQKIKEKTGGRLRLLVAGGASLAPEISEVFLGMGISIVEGYGLTESSPVLAINLPENNKPGSVGPPIPGVTVTIAPDGEILAKGPNIMLGYYKNRQATEESLKDGWLYTGDIGFLDDDGYLTITDRKKDLIITSGGKNIAPQAIENAIKLSPFVEHVVLTGDNERFIGALVVPPWETIDNWAPALGWSTNPSELARDLPFQEFIAREIQLKMKGFAAYEKVKRFEIIDRPFTVDTGELTPSLKIRRKFVYEKFKKAIERLYA